MTKYGRKHWLWIVVNVGALIPLVNLLRRFLADQIIDPIGELTNLTGYVALVLLVLSLAVSPLISLTGWRKLITVRKSLGLQGFLYVSIHLITFIGLDYGLNLDLILGDALLTKRYVIVGFAAFFLLLPLAVTSTRGWMKRLGRNWKRLHRLVYVAVPLGALHFIWVEKVPVEPVVWAVTIALLLLARVAPIRKRLTSFHRYFDSVTRPSRTSTTPKALGS